MDNSDQKAINLLGIVNRAVLSNLAIDPSNRSICSAAPLRSPYSSDEVRSPRTGIPSTSVIITKLEVTCISINIKMKKPCKDTDISPFRSHFENKDPDRN